ncbi:tape measure protein [Streptomyces phage AxeJC]|uniref:Tape measure protein n=1 Tax=Streptomyces phage AxeJC TaxID=2926084 RepID=A0A9E7E5F4_9CAUD|nr:tape measure protein [Streptomyces phage AxeJC]URC17939.1 tape measure protein [Streptomyces phage AxeJC]
MMALTIGELTGYITIDDRAVRPALSRAEEEMRTAGRRITTAAGQAGEAAGQALGDATADGARDGLGEVETAARSAGRQAGDALATGVQAGLADVETAARASGRRAGDDLADGVQSGIADLDDGARAAGRRAGAAVGDGLADGGEAGAGRLRQVAENAFGKVKLAAAAAGIAAGAVLMQGIGTALEQGKITGRLQAQLGATPAVAKRYGKIAGQIYADAVTEDFQGATDAISATMRAGLLPTGATNAQIREISTNVTDLASTFELDLGQTANAVGQVMKTGLAPNAKIALDVITKGLQKMGPRADDIADTFNEYSVIFQRLGLNVKTATGLMSQGLKAGARDTDVVADALKEFTIEAVAGSDKIVGGFRAVGLDANKMVKMISQGGPQATKALQMTLDALREMEDPVKRDAAAVELFGTKSEDMQKALLALDPKSAVDALGEVGGAANGMGDALRDNAATRVEAFKRGLQQNVVDFLGTKVIPALTGLKAYVTKHLKNLWEEAGKGTDSKVDQAAKFVELLAQRIGEKLMELGPKMIDWLQQAGQKAAAYIAENPDKVFKVSAIAAAITAGVITLPGLIAGALVTSAAIITTNFTKELITKTNEKLAEWWMSFGTWISEKAASAGGVMNSLGSAIGGWFSDLWANYISGPVSRTWNDFIATVQGLPGRAGAALSGLGSRLSESARQGWSRFQAAAAARVADTVTWVRGIPSRISSAVGNLGSLLYSKGQDVARGLWQGIQGMGGWLKGQLMSWARSVVPGPIAKALGIHSPSKVTAAQGKWIARGLIKGLTGSEKQVRAASAKLADAVADGLRPGKKRSKALGKISSGSKKLVQLARQEERVASQLKAAQKKLASQIAARDKLAADVRKGVLDSGAITSMDGPATADTIINTLSARVDQAQRFAQQLAQLKKKGVRSDLIAQIASAGVDQGAASAAVLANASASQIKQINSQQAALVKAANAAGKTAGDAMYGSGIQAAQGLVKGLQSQQTAIEKQMLKIATGMQKAIKKALGIKSPSRVMAALGRFIPQGLVQGIDGGRGAVDASMSALVDPSAVPIPSGSMATAGAGAGSGGSAGRTVIEIRSSGARRDDALLEELRHAIRVRGGDVQLVLAGKR